MATLRELFEEAKQKILDDKWTAVDWATSWRDILPCPDLSILPEPLPLLKMLSRLSGSSIHIATKRENQLTWENWAMTFFNKNKVEIDQKLDQMKSYLDNEVVSWNGHHKTKHEQLSAEQIYRQWLTSIRTLSLKEFCRLLINAYTAKLFISPKFKAIKDRYEVGSDEQPIAMSSNDFSKSTATLLDYIGLELSESNIKKIVTSKRYCLYAR